MLAVNSVIWENNISSNGRTCIKTQLIRTHLIAIGIRTLYEGHSFPWAVTGGAPCTHKCKGATQRLPECGRVDKIDVGNIIIVKGGPVSALLLT